MNSKAPVPMSPGWMAKQWAIELRRRAGLMTQNQPERYLFESGAKYWESMPEDYTVPRSATEILNDEKYNAPKPGRSKKSQAIRKTLWGEQRPTH